MSRLEKCFWCVWSFLFWAGFLLAILGMAAKGHCQTTTILSDATSSTFTCYMRYSGFCQGSPLSDADKKLDAAYEEIDRTLEKLGDEPMAFITINEYQRVMYLSDKMIWFNKAEQIYSAERDLKDILQKIETRRAKEPR